MDPASIPPSTDQTKENLKATNSSPVSSPNHKVPHAKKSQGALSRQKPTKRAWSTLTPQQSLRIAQDYQLADPTTGSLMRSQQRMRDAESSVQLPDDSLEAMDQLPLYQVLHAYQARNCLELSLAVDEFVDVIDQKPLEFWFVHNLAGEEGWVPSACLQNINPDPPTDISGDSTTKELLGIQGIVGSGTINPTLLLGQTSVATETKDYTLSGIFSRPTHPDDNARYELVNKIKRSAQTHTGEGPRRRSAQWPKSMLLEDLALDKIEVVSSQDLCNFCEGHTASYGCADDRILLPAEAATGVCDSCKLATADDPLNFSGFSDFSSMFSGIEETFPPMKTRPEKVLPSDGRIKISNTYMNILFCKYSPYGYIDITKAKICPTCKDFKQSIMNHRHLEFAPSGAQGCMVCTNSESFQCTGCPLQLCAMCSAHVAETDKGDLDFLIYYRSERREHVRNDVVLLRKDGGGY